MLISKQDKQYLFDSVESLRDDSELTRHSLENLCDALDMMLDLIANPPKQLAPLAKKAAKKAKKAKK